MSSKRKGVKKIFSTIWSEDVRTITIAILLIITIWNVYAMGLGWLSSTGLAFNTPSISRATRSTMLDSDGDLLPDLVELTPAGENVILNNQVIGKGTGTDPNKKDTDGDLFTDGAEDNLGTDPNNWLSPGYIWLLWIFVIAAFAFSKFTEKNLLKEYQEFEDTQSSGVTGESKFAHGGTSVFAQQTAKLSEEEKKKLIQSDARFHRMTADAVAKTPRKIRKRNYKKIIAQSLVVLFIVFIIQYLVTDST